MNDMIELANIALRKLGEVDLVDTSLTVAGFQTEYTLPSTIRTKPFAVKVQEVTGSTNNNMWREVNFDVIPATPGSNWTLVIPEYVNGQTIQVWYRGLHPEVTAFSSDISETIHPDLATCALIAEAYQWYNNRIGGSNEYFLQRENKAMQDLNQAKVDHPVYRAVEKLNGFPHWSNSNRYVPLTSDLRA